MSFFGRILRAGEGKKVRALSSLVPDVNALEPEIEKLSDEALRAKTGEFRQRIERATSDGVGVQQALNDLLLESFAVVREAARRAIGQRHFDVQIMGGAALHFGWIAEMKTGEGKTLVSTLPIYLNALAGEGVHLATTNDYLAAFHAEWMGRIYGFLGLSTGHVSQNVRHDVATKQAAYGCDITYGTHQEFGFDYLLDNLVPSLDKLRQRGHFYAIVDEVDSILIDEARTPLIISGPAAEATKLYQQFAGIARSLTRDTDYEVDEEKRNVAVTEEGIEKVERMLGVENLYDLVHLNYVHQLQQSLRAKELYKNDKDYVVIDREVKIVDEFTGRILDGRRWSEGLHQAIEAKERVPIQQENVTQATVTLQNYFRMYEKLAGMTGTAETEAAEFASTYDLPVVPIPTNKPLIRKDEPDLIYKTEKGKFDSVVADIEQRYMTGQPVLVGTASVAKSEVLSQLLERHGIPHRVLNAKTQASATIHAREASIIAQAGRLHSVTVSTNMAGRGVDILLGGNPEGLAADEVIAQGLDPETDEGRVVYEQLLPKYEAECKAEGDKIRELGGLYVLGTERHESRRIDNQLRGRSGRQGDPGESRFYLSLEDDLMRLFATGALNWVMGRALPEDVPIESKMVTKSVQRAQTVVESRNAEIRKNVLEYDEVYNEQRKVIYARRRQVLEGGDLREETLSLIEGALDGVVMAFCTSEFPEEWDVGGLLTELKTYYPSEFTEDDLRQAATAEQLSESVIADAIGYYERREAEIGPELMRELERRIMLQIIDQHWVEHLSEMDYLREGIYLRQMGQKDPLVEWKREGFDMFGQTMAAIEDDYVKYVTHVQVQVVEQAPAEPDFSRSEMTAADDTAQPVGAALDAAPPDLAAASAGSASPTPDQLEEEAEPVQAPIQKDERDKLGRNDPCWCGSGRKFKHCHGA